MSVRGNICLLIHALSLAFGWKMSQYVIQPKMNTAGVFSAQWRQLLTLYLCLLVQVTTDFRFRIGSSKLPEFAKSHPIGLVMLCTLLIYPSKQYSITWSVKTCLRTYLLSVLWGWKKTSLAILLSPNVTSAELLWVNLGNNGIYFCIYLGKLGESTALQGQ